MTKPQVNINLNIDVPMDIQDSDGIEEQLKDAMSRAHKIIEELEDGCSVVPDHDQKPPKRVNQPTTSRHWQAVDTNNRISDAIEFVNKEIKLQKGSGDNGCLKILEELKLILLGIVKY